jgi:opacity protein-like surface antigen
MRRVLGTLVLMTGMIAAAPGVARAQSGASPTPAFDTGYAEGVAQSAFGNVTTQSYGAELGVTITAGLQVFVEGGQTRNVATPEIGVSAQKIADFLQGQLPSQAVDHSVKVPATFFVGGLRYLIPISGSGKSPIGKAQPYVMGGFGIARVERNVSFTIAGTDVTGNLQQYGVILGTDLSGNFTKPMLTLGGGVTLPIWRQLLLDFQYRYGRIFADDQAIVVQRAGVGFGVGF